MLLAAAALMARSLQHTRSLDVGFRSSGVVYTHADMRRYGYSPAATVDFYRRLDDRARALPGVTAVAWTTHVPLTGGVVRAALRPEGHASDTVTKYTEVSPSYFDVLGISIVEGLCSRTKRRRAASRSRSSAVPSPGDFGRMTPHRRVSVRGRSESD